MSKKMKRFLSILLAVALVAALPLNALAQAGTDAGTGEEVILEEFSEDAASEAQVKDGSAAEIDEIQARDDAEATTEAGETVETVNMRNTPFISGTGNHKNEKVTKITINVGISYTLTLKDSLSAKSWSSSDTKVATVSNGTVEGKGEGTTYITATIAEGEYTIPVTVVSSNATNSTNVKYIDIYLAEILNTTAYYSLSVNEVSTEVKQNLVQKGEAIYLKYTSDSNLAIQFFGAPDEGYALTRLGSTNSDSQYYSINSTSASNTEFFTADTGACKNMKNNFGSNNYSLIQTMISNAMSLGCKGAMGFCRYKQGTQSDSTGYKSTINSSLTFVSAKLPTVEKKVVSITRNRGESVEEIPYTDGMSAIAGDVINYEVTIKNYKSPTDADYVYYSDVNLTDNLGNAMFTKSKSSSQSVSGLPTSTSYYNEDKEISYGVTYTIQEKDIGKNIINTVDLVYAYESKYCNSKFSDSAEAKAELSVAEFEFEDVVLDFGLPVEIDYSEKIAQYAINDSITHKLSDNVAEIELVKNSDATNYKNGFKIIYTPKTVLTEADEIYLTNDNGATYTIHVYPATSVYYEESFATITKNTESEDTNGIESVAFKQYQTYDKVGDGDTYGYDASYSVQSENSGNSYATLNTGESATFTFNGTGCDIYTRTSEKSGNLMVLLYKEQSENEVSTQSDNTEDAEQIDTISDDSINWYLDSVGIVYTSNTWLENVTRNYYNTPVFSFTDLDVGNYKVVLTAFSDGENDNYVDFDGFRIYGTQGITYDAIYAEDKEASPQTVEVRDVSIAGFNLDLSSSDLEYIISAKTTNLADGETISKIISAVYDPTNVKGDGAIILDASSEDTDVSKVIVDDELINNGPKNEMYLTNNQALVMKIKDGANYGKIAFGIRSLNGGKISYKINEGNEETCSSSIDMYYEVNPNDNGMIVIQNTGENVIALTKIKATAVPTITAAGASTPAKIASRVASDSLKDSITVDEETIAYALECIFGRSDSTGTTDETDDNKEKETEDQSEQTPATDETNANQTEGSTTTEQLAQTGATANTITVSWIKDSAAKAGYRIYIKGGAFKKYTKVDDVAASKTSMTIKKAKKKRLAAGTKYTVKIVSLTRAGKSTKYEKNPQVVKAVTLTKAASIKGAKSKKNASTVSWNTSKGASGYEVEMSRGNRNSFLSVALVGSSKSSYTQKNLTKGTYYFRVRSYVKNGDDTFYGSWTTAKKVTVK